MTEKHGRTPSWSWLDDDAQRLLKPGDFLEYAYISHAADYATGWCIFKVSTFLEDVGQLVNDERTFRAATDRLVSADAILKVPTYKGGSRGPDAFWRPTDLGRVSEAKAIPAPPRSGPWEGRKIKLPPGSSPTSDVGDEKRFYDQIERVFPDLSRGERGGLLNVAHAHGDDLDAMVIELAELEPNTGEATEWLDASGFGESDFETTRARFGQ